MPTGWASSRHIVKEMGLSDIEVSEQGACLTIRLNRPDKKNSITAAMYQTMADALVKARGDASLRVVQIVGLPGVFTAGNDLGDFLNNPPHGSNSPVFQFLDNVSKCEKPIIAAVDGIAVGIGTTMLFHCDYVVASDTAKFSMPFAQLGLVPEAASSYLLPLIAGYQRAARHLMLGEAFGTADAREAGFVTEVVSADQVFARAEAIAAKFAALPPKSVRMTKSLLKSAHTKQIEAQMAEEGGHFRAMLTEPAAKEAFTAFFERRKPDFSSLT
jgi:enoyl-CoA hydratase/carnithine racemase